VTNSAGLGSAEEEAPAVVAAGRTIGGILLVLIGVALVLVGAFVYFIVPFIELASDDRIWSTLSALDFVFVLIGGIGLVLAFVGGAVVRRARKRNLAMFVDGDGSALATLDLSGDAIPDEKRTGERPPTIL
jgi:hypothetical protein